MSGKRYTEECKIAAVKQVAQRGHPASAAAARLGVSIHSLCTWTKRYGMPKEARRAVDSRANQVRRLKAELKRVTEARDILRKAAVYLAKASGSGTTSSLNYRPISRYKDYARCSGYIPAVSMHGVVTLKAPMPRKTSACWFSSRNHGLKAAAPTATARSATTRANWIKNVVAIASTGRCDQPRCARKPAAPSASFFVRSSVGR